MKKAPLITLFIANAISMVGNVFALIAVPWFVLQTTGSPAKTGLTGFFITLAAVIAAFLGGAIVDRLGFKRTSVLADVASGVAFALIPLLYATTGLQFWQLLLLVFAGNFLDAPGTTAREALAPELAEEAGVRLETVSAAIQAVERGARMLGAPLAGVLVVVVGARNVLWFDAASFGISALLVALAVPNLKRQFSKPKEGRRYVAELKEGVDFIFRDQLLFAVMLLVVIVNFLDAPLSGVLYPLYIKTYYGDALNLGVLVSAGGAGALFSAILYGAFGHRLPRRAVFFAGFILVTLRFWVHAAVPPFFYVVLATLISGIGAGPINPILYTIEFERIPVDYRGRVLGTLTALAYIAMPLGMLAGGYLLEWVDTRLALILIGICYLSAILAFLFHPATRGMNAALPALAAEPPAS